MAASFISPIMDSYASGSTSVLYRFSGFTRTMTLLRMLKMSGVMLRWLGK